MSLEKIIDDINKGIFLEKLTTDERVKELLALDSPSRQKVIFQIAKINAKDKKHAREIFETLKKVCGDDFLKTPTYQRTTAFHYAAEENADKDTTPQVIGTLVAEYSYHEDNVINYTAKIFDSTEAIRTNPSLTFLFNITEEPSFRQKAAELREEQSKALIAQQKSSR